MTELTLELARAALNYDPETGEFIRVGGRSDYVGRVAGTTHASGYRFVQVNRKLYLGHRLAWFMTYGVFPEKHIDHINGDKLDNRISNLRLATRSQNLGNRGVQKNNTSGAAGVSWQKSVGRWQAKIMHEGRDRYLGTFDRVEDAKAAYDKEALRLRGEFAKIA